MLFFLALLQMTLQPGHYNWVECPEIHQLPLNMLSDARRSPHTIFLSCCRSLYPITHFPLHHHLNPVSPSPSSSFCSSPVMGVEIGDLFLQIHPDVIALRMEHLTLLVSFNWTQTCLNLSQTQMKYPSPNRKIPLAIPNLSNAHNVINQAPVQICFHWEESQTLN